MTPRNLVGLVFNPQVADAAELVRSLVDSLDLGGRCWVSSAGQLEDVRERLDATSMVVTVGGDGTILRAVRVIAPFEIPIVGINMGRVGFMTELKVEEAAGKLPAYLNGDVRIEERMMLEASVASRHRGKSRVLQHALNDVVVGRARVVRLLDIRTTVDGIPLTSYRADAVIVSTATGSTGYALSAGGPILYPEARLMLVQPVAAHTGLRDGLVLPEDSVVELSTSEARAAALSVDGFQDIALEADDVVTVRRAPYVARFLRAGSPSSFYAALTRRLGPVYGTRPPEAGE